MSTIKLYKFAYVICLSQSFIYSPPFCWLSSSQLLHAIAVDCWCRYRHTNSERHFLHHFQLKRVASSSSWSVWRVNLFKQINLLRCNKFYAPHTFFSTHKFSPTIVFEIFCCLVAGNFFFFIVIIVVSLETHDETFILFNGQKKSTPNRRELSDMWKYLLHALRP